MTRFGWLALLLTFPLSAQIPAEPAGIPTDPAAIMALVAANVKAAEPARRSYVYHQTVRSSLTKTNGNPVRRERREYDAVPGESATEKNLTEFDGERYQGKKAERYSQPSNDDDMDSELIHDLTEDLVDDKDSRDGIPHDLFPLPAEDLPNYTFTLKDRTELAGRPVLKIAFEPRKDGPCVDAKAIKADFSSGEEHCSTPWKGEVWVDAEDLQPARIVTNLAKGLPWGVRVFLGTNIKQLGFSLDYQRVAPNVWFPVAYGTEFRLDLLFFYKRNVALSLESSNFRKTDASSTIQFTGTNSDRPN